MLCESECELVWAPAPLCDPHGIKGNMDRLLLIILRTLNLIKMMILTPDSADRGDGLLLISCKY